MENHWNPIETAPKDTALLLYWPPFMYCGYESSPGVAIGWFKTNPRILAADAVQRGPLVPDYFSPSSELDDYEFADPANAPTHWMPLPSPPLTVIDGGKKEGA